MEVLPGNFLILGTALAVGLAFGFVLQRGRYCVNTAFRDIIFINDFTLFRAYLLSLVVAIVAANAMEDMGWLGGVVDAETNEYVAHTLRRQSFAPIANIVGGYIFGLGIVLAGGCGSGILYRVGEGLVASVFAVFGFAFGILATMYGFLNPVFKALKSYKMEIGDSGNPALWDLFGGGQTAKWATILVVVVIMAVFVIKGKPFEKGPAKGYKWSVAGLLVGIVAVIAWWASGVFGGQPRGLSFTGPTADFFMGILTRNSNAPSDPMFDFWGLTTTTWSAWYILTVPVGAFLSAKALGEFKLKAPGAGELMTVFFGAMMMGFGAAIAGG
jgi:hypothetical protein